MEVSIVALFVSLLFITAFPRFSPFTPEVLPLPARAMFWRAISIDRSCHYSSCRLDAFAWYYSAFLVEPSVVRYLLFPAVVYARDHGGRVDEVMLGLITEAFFSPSTNEVDRFISSLSLVYCVQEGYCHGGWLSAIPPSLLYHHFRFLRFCDYTLHWESYYFVNDYLGGLAYGKFIREGFYGPFNCEFKRSL